MSHPTLNRRQFHRQLQASAMALALAPWQTPAWAQPTAERNWKTSPFQLGVASGSPQHDSLVIWTRLIVTDEDRKEVDADGVAGRYEIYADEGLRRLVRSGDWHTNATRGHSVHVVVPGLAPARSYWYRFMCGDAVSRVGRTQTAPAPDADVLLMEGTYGDRDHRPYAQTLEEFRGILRAAVATGGKVLIPSFALERTQDVLYQIARLEEAGGIPGIPVYVDSPLAAKVETVYAGFPAEFDPRLQRFFQHQGDPFRPRRLQYTRTIDDSRKLNSLEGAAVIIAGSGMDWPKLMVAVLM